MRTIWFLFTRVTPVLAVLLTGLTVNSAAPSTAMSAGQALFGCPVGTPDVALSTEEILTTTVLRVPPGHPIRTTARLVVPTHARWATRLTSESLVLTVTAGALQVTLTDGSARVAPSPGSWPTSFLPRDLAAGESIELRAMDRLVMHGAGSLAAQNIGQGAVVATVIRVGSPP